MNMDSCSVGIPGHSDGMEVEALVGDGFTHDEIVSLVRLRQWYQTDGSDRVGVKRYWEFLKFLVRSGKLHA